MDPLRAVSVLVPTYGRTRVLGECVQSFLQQDYDGISEMVILNDHPEQKLILDPTAFDQRRPVTIINVTQRFPDLGTKRNTLVDMAAYPLVAFWDDDDIYLKHALSTLAILYDRMLAKHRRTSRTSHVWQLQKDAGTDRARGFPSPVATPELGVGTELAVRDSGCLWSMLMEKAAIHEVGGFPADERKQDCALLHKLTRAEYVQAEGNTPGNPSCIHRLATTAYPHAVDFASWRSAEDNAAASAHMAAQVKALMDDGLEPRGEVGINPVWQHDYEAITTRAWLTPDPLRTHPRIGET